MVKLYFIFLKRVFGYREAKLTIFILPKLTRSHKKYK